MSLRVANPTDRWTLYVKAARLLLLLLLISTLHLMIPHQVAGLVVMKHYSGGPGLGRALAQACQVLYPIPEGGTAAHLACPCHNHVLITLRFVGAGGRHLDCLDVAVACV